MDHPFMAEAHPLPVEQRARLLDGLGQAVVATDTGGVVVYWNDAAADLYGWSAAEALGRGAVELLEPQPGGGGSMRDVLGTGKVWSGGRTVRHRDGALFTALVTVAIVEDDAGQFAGVVGVSTNVGRMLQPLLERGHEAALVVNADGVVRFASPAVERVLGWAGGALAGRLLLDLVHAEDRAEVDDCALSSIADPAVACSVDFRALTAAGNWAWVAGLAVNLLDDPTVAGLVWTLRDSSKQRAALDHMTRVALHDPLTGLPNRALLSERLTQATARREPSGALLFIDMDDFKLVNDEYGHAAGDALLKAVADRLRSVVRPEDACGRWSGDEFLLLTESLQTEDEAHALARRVGEAIAQPLEITGLTLRASASIGVAMLEGIREPEQLLSLADSRMYRAKDRRRLIGGPTEHG